MVVIVFIFVSSVSLALDGPSLAARYLEKKTRRFFDLFRAPPFLFPRVHPRLTR